jgi:hypothetical protein
MVVQAFADVPLYVPPNLYTNLTNLTGQTLSGGDTTTNPPTPAGDYFVLVNGRYTLAFDGAITVTVQ